MGAPTRLRRAAGTTGPVSPSAVVPIVVAMAKHTGWYPDPARRDRLRYRDDSRWTKWAFDGDHVVEDPVGAEASVAAIRRRRQERWVIGVVLAIIGSSIFVGCFSLVDRAMRSSELAGTADVVAEMNTWELPPSVARSTRADHIERGNFGASGPTVTRWFDPVGTTPADAMLDLTSSLNAQGYEFTEDAQDSWSSECRYNSKYCTIDIGLDPTGQRIEVYVTPGS